MSKRVSKVPEHFDPSDVHPQLKSSKKVPTAAAAVSTAFATFKQLESDARVHWTQLEETERSILEMESKYLDSSKRGFGNALVGARTPGKPCLVAASMPS